MPSREPLKQLFLDKLLRNEGLDRKVEEVANEGLEVPSPGILVDLVGLFAAWHRLGVTDHGSETREKPAGPNSFLQCTRKC